ncbi:Crp/Fnr family transcriptional regulator [Candidatus Nitronereus thalassa]|uniref:Crp/Fnr family transcriptional regulator n=1 Tax=Candidatus Nitronereus thalassa TaxID=3020898 RepID=A0ABU3K4K0_9BACT|nr:Crp/Fnr family transcriptional regulator [Candidatus Nitronereus thalassa]MDT7041287.1 Crp/Fnr family transcriptional regulator [Candidatus Nitronereus thalassa]
MKMKRDHLKTIPLFSELTNAELDLILEKAREQRYPRGSIVFYEGDPGDFLMVVLTGKVKVVLLGEGGQEIILAMLGPGNFFGEMAILEAAPRSATVMTAEQSEFLILEQPSFSALIELHPSISQKILKHLSERLRQADEQIRSLAMFDIYGRIAQCLLRLGQTQGKRVDGTLIISDRPSFQELSHMIGCSRETVSRAMKVLQEDGYLSVTRKEITIMRPWHHHK